MRLRRESTSYPARLTIGSRFSSSTSLPARGGQVERHNGVGYQAGQEFEHAVSESPHVLTVRVAILGPALFLSCIMELIRHFLTTQ
jgi:hypothetical protein